MKNKILLFLFLLIIVIIIAFIYFRNMDSREENNNKSDLIKVNNLKPNQIITSPLIITGEARGYWFFEASFPIKIYDADNNLLGIGIAQAQDEWMTEVFVPFRAELEYSVPETKTGVLVLEKDNPSGLPENADELRIPIRFDEQETMVVKAFFNNDNLDPEYSCNKVFPVERMVFKTQAVARKAIEELLKGPIETEKDQGFFTSINSGVKIQKLTIENGIAKIDFDDSIEFQVGGSCRISAIRAQIIETLKQFSIVQDVIISVNGRIEDILQP